MASSIPPNMAVSEQSFPHLSRAVERLTEAALRQWQAHALGEPLPDGKDIKPRSGAYARSILSKAEGPFAGVVYSSLPYARVIEEGAQSWDMKKILHSSWKVRISKEGRRYLVIPFRHNAPDSQYGPTMSEDVHAWWQEPKRERSHVTGTYRRLSGHEGYDVKTRQRVTVQGWRYSWGSRLTRDDLEEMGGHSEQQIKRMEGMVNFRRPDAKGGGGHSQYITFRNMVEGSPGWIMPAREGLHPAKQVADKIGGIAEEVFREAAARDVQAALGQS